MPDTIIYPTSVEISAIAQDLLPRFERGRIGLDLFPIVTSDTDTVRWEQYDNFTGLQQVRGLNGAPQRVRRVGAKGYEMQPGAYGEYQVIDEQELTRRRQLGTMGDPIRIDDLVMMADQHLLQRELDRIEEIIWTLLTTGTFASSGPAGILHTDVFPINTFTAVTAWSTTATSTPIADLRTISLLSRGTSTVFDGRATLYVNKKKVHQLLSNSNASDLGGYNRPTSGDLNTRSLADVNRILLDQDLPQIVAYDAGYINDAGTFTPFIADNKGVLIGQRANGETIGEYRMTRNANNPDLAPGRYIKIVDDPNKVPRTIEYHRGHNGGPCIYYPGAVVALTI